MMDEATWFRKRIRPLVTIGSLVTAAVLPLAVWRAANDPARIIPTILLYGATTVLLATLALAERSLQRRGVTPTAPIVVIAAPEVVESGPVR